MSNTGYQWDAAWTTLQNAVTLTQGGTVEDLSAAVSNDGKAACVVSVDADYGNYAKATAGLKVFVLNDVNGTDYEDDADGAWGMELNYTQAGTNRLTFAVPADVFASFKILLQWGNSTASSTVTVTTSYWQATIPAAS